MKPEVDTNRHFLKTLPATDYDRLEAEADGLAALRATGTVRVPEVIAIGRDDVNAWLLLARLELGAWNRAGGAALGHALAAMHRHVGTGCGWSRDNYIGATPQSNTLSDSWPLFYARHRLMPQFALARAAGMERTLCDKLERIIENTAAFFLGGHPAPSLLHGDLWSGNAGLLPDGTPTVFDPAVYYGDRETDLALAELFGGFPESFYAAYREAWPLPEGFAVRKTLYNLYHVLNHYHLFGAGYLGQARRMIDRLLAELRG